MYTIEILIGTILTIFGLLVLAYLSYARFTQKPVSVLYISEALATFLIGILHITCAALLAGKKDPEIIDEFANITFYDSRDMDDIFDVNNFYQEDSLLEETQHNGSDALSGFLKEYKLNGRSLEMQDCDFDEVYLKYALLVISFIYGLIAVLISTQECKNCEIKIDAEESDDKVFTQRRGKELDVDKEKVKNNRKNLGQISLAWLVPIMYTVIVYYSMKQNFPEDLKVVKKLNDIKPTASEIMTIIEKPMNVTNTEKKEEVDQIINKIYNIVAEAKEKMPHSKINPSPFVMNDIIDYFNNRKARSLDLNCDYKNMPLKLHTMLLFIIGYFAALFYSKNTHTMLEVSRKFEQNRVSQLGKYIIAFGTLWLPSVLEVFTRTYLMDYRPGIVADICLGVGNITRIVANIFNVWMVKDVFKKHSNVIHSV